jgi:hypothetical protein
MLETALVRAVRARQEADATETELELLAELFRDWLFEALKTPEVRTAICNIVAADTRPKPKPTTRGARRG